MSIGDAIFYSVLVVSFLAFLAFIFYQGMKQ